MSLGHTPEAAVVHKDFACHCLFVIILEQDNATPNVHLCENPMENVEVIIDLNWVSLKGILCDYNKAELA